MAVTFISDNTGDQININKDGSLNVRASGVVHDSWEGSTTATFTFDEPLSSIAISNDDAEAVLTLTIEGIVTKVLGHEGFNDVFPPFKSVQITATGPYRALVRK